jgi:hypothetical protein
VKTFAAALIGALLIPIPQWGDVSLVEAVWTLVGVAALVVSMISLPKVTVDFIVAKHAHPSQLSDARVLLARGHVRRELIRLAQSLIILAIGIFADVTPNPFRSVTLTGLVLTIGLIGLASLAALQSLLDKVQRDQAEALLWEVEEDDA